PTPKRGTKARPQRRRPGLVAYSRSAGARVALLRSPILPTTRRTIARRNRIVQPRIILGGKVSLARGDKVRTADISNVAKMRTFLMSPDSRLKRIVAVAAGPRYRSNSFRRWKPLALDHAP